MLTTSRTPRPDRRPAQRPVHRAARRAAVLVLVLASASVVAACSAPDPEPTVASLPSAAPTAPPAAPTSSAPPDGGTATPAPGTQGPGDAGSSDASGGHPQFRLDDTDERRTALVNAYSQCLLDHGATKGEGRAAAAAAAGDAGSGTPLIVVADPVPAAASAACADVLPQLPPELEAATNPEFHDQSQAYVQCMRDRGLWVQLLNNSDLDWTYLADHPVPENSEQIEHDCLMEAFS